jgi:hypothetical protein
MPMYTFLHNLLNVLVHIANKMRLQKKKVRLRHDFRTRHLCVYFGAVYIPEEGLKALLTQLRYLATVPCTGNWHKQQITTACGLLLVVKTGGGGANFHRSAKLCASQLFLRSTWCFHYHAQCYPTATCVTALSRGYWRCFLSIARGHAIAWWLRHYYNPESRGFETR